MEKCIGMATKLSLKPLIIGMIAVFIATFTLFFIFDSIQKLADRCQTEKLEICDQLRGPSLTLIIILLLIMGLVFVILVIVYILITL